MQPDQKQALIAIVRDTPSSWECYRRLDDEMASGLLVYLAGPTEEGIREIEVWRSGADAERYERAGPMKGLAKVPTRAATVRSLVVERIHWPTNDREDA